jgi:hypothetical protein
MSVKATVEDNYEQAEKNCLSYLRAADVSALSAASFKTFVSAGGTLYHQRDFHISVGTSRFLKEQDQQEREAVQEEERQDRRSYYQYLWELREYGYDSG